MSELTHSPATAEETQTRHGVIRRFGVVGATIFGALAARGQAAQAGNWLCCFLYYPNTSQWCNTTSYGNFVCPSGWAKRAWYCCQGVDLVGCGECVKGGTTCSNADSYNCSYGWIARRGGC